MRAYRAATLLLGAMLASPVCGGVVVETIQLDYWTSEPQETRTRIYAQDSKLKMMFRVDGEPSGEIIFRGDLWERWRVDYARRTYDVEDLEGMRRIAEWMAASRSKKRETNPRLEAMQREGIRTAIRTSTEGMFGNEPHQRLMAEVLIEQKLAAADREAAGLAPEREETELLPTSERDTREGFAASRWERWTADTKTADLWMVDLQDITEVRELFAVLEEMHRFHQETRAILEPGEVDGRLTGDAAGA